MSSPAYALPLRIERRPSRGLACVVAVTHALAVMVLLPLDLPWWSKSLLAAAVFVQAMITWRHHVRPSAAGAVHALTWRADGDWELSRGDGAVHAAVLRRASYVQPALVVLRFKAEDGGRYAVLLPADGVDPETHRRLRVGLRLQAGSSSERL